MRLQECLWVILFIWCASVFGDAFVAHRYRGANGAVDSNKKTFPEKRCSAGVLLNSLKSTKQHSTDPTTLVKVPQLVLENNSTKETISTSCDDDDDDCEILEPVQLRAYPQQTPHSGRHFIPSHPAYEQQQQSTAIGRMLRPLTFLWRRTRRNRNRRFTEGWYYRLTLPEDQGNVSFAFIVSIEDPGHDPPSELRLACIQIIGPNDEYIVQASREDTSFWAWRQQQGVGCTFQYKDALGPDRVQRLKLKTALSRKEWDRTIESGFQILPTSLRGRIRGRDGTKYDIPEIVSNQGEILSCDFDLTIDPICGWGGTTSTDQKSTAGWLSSFPVFEPHWQITLADAKATGTVRWQDQVYTFSDAPFYAEKNWGAALPRKWYWTQCNSFRGGYNQLSVVAGGGIRQVPLGKEEALGMVSVHYNGVLYEAVPWLGGMSWNVTTWGSWILRGNSTCDDRPFEVEVVFTCNPQTTPGLVFRAPTPDRGLVRFCRDTFHAECTLSLWDLVWDDIAKQYVRKDGPPRIDRAQSHQGGAEIGGGPWWDTWSDEARLKKPIQALLRVPYNFYRFKQRLRSFICLPSRRSRDTLRSGSSFSSRIVVSTKPIKPWCESHDYPSK